MVQTSPVDIALRLGARRSSDLHVCVCVCVCGVAGIGKNKARDKG